MVSSRLAILAVVIVMVAIAGGAIAYYNGTYDAGGGYVGDIDHNDFAKKPKMWGASGSTDQDFHVKITCPGCAAAGYPWGPVKVWSNDWDLYGEENNAWGQIRVTQKMHEPGGSPVKTNILELWGDESPPRTRIYDIDTWKMGDGTIQTKCTYGDDTTGSAGLDAVSYFGYNENAGMELLGCSNGDCTWRVWDGDTQIGSWSTQTMVSDQESGQVKEWSMRATTHEDGDVAVANWNYCALDCDSSGYADCATLTLEEGCSCSSFPPADGAEWCGNMLMRFVIEASGVVPSDIFDRPQVNGASACTSNAEGEGTYDDVGSSFRHGIQPLMIGSNHVQGREATEDDERTFMVASQAAKTDAGEKVFTAQVTAGQILATLSDKEYGRFCGAGTPLENGDTSACSEAAGNLVASPYGVGEGVCDDGGFDSCCQRHDHGTWSKPDTLLGIDVTYSYCKVDDNFKQCLNSASQECETNSIDSNGHHCYTAKAAASVAFELIPCYNYETWKVPGWCGWYPCWKTKTDYTFYPAPWIWDGPKTCNGACQKDGFKTCKRIGGGDCYN